MKSTKIDNFHHEHSFSCTTISNINILCCIKPKCRKVRLEIRVFEKPDRCVPRVVEFDAKFINEID